jgi:oligopeptide transport system permease protein
VLLLLLSTVLRPGVVTMLIAVSATGWLSMARLIRNWIMIIRDREYNLASRCLGTPTSRIIIKNLLPHIISVLMLSFALAIPSTIGYEVFLTYVGVGLPDSVPSLGNLISKGRLLLPNKSLRYQLIIPASILSAITVSFYKLGNSFSDAADPRNHV